MLCNNLRKSQDLGAVVQTIVSRRHERWLQYGYYKLNFPHRISMIFVTNGSKSVHLILKIKFKISSIGMFCNETTLKPSKNAVRLPDKPVTGEMKPAAATATLPPFPLQHRKSNWVGPPHPKSNLRLVSYYQVENESSIERHLRERRIEVQEWNHRFWEDHNKSFYKMKEEFLNRRKQELFGKDAASSKISPALPPEELSKFYKQFLDDNYAVHMRYNKEWYKKNIGLLLPAVLVFLFQLAKKMKLIKS